MALGISEAQKPQARTTGDHARSQVPRTQAHRAQVTNPTATPIPRRRPIRKYHRPTTSPYWLGRRCGGAGWASLGALAVRGEWREDWGGHDPSGASRHLDAATGEMCLLCRPTAALSLQPVESTGQTEGRRGVGEVSERPSSLPKRPSDPLSYGRMWCKVRAKNRGGLFILLFLGLAQFARGMPAYACLCTFSWKSKV
ncbi:hypothetical protein B0T19DRAFT_422169 [Cercophora scortea]|uniref:Uncharacterized protein n=1 Tax=Cercophora scortea TaxID=314031 RepID=A0AAE0ILY2_9PEZI|nr:hypothetical protein B0T19DRAFT_422169 [Cercophora scortea]